MPKTSSNSKPGPSKRKNPFIDDEAVAERKTSKSKKSGKKGPESDDSELEFMSPTEESESDYEEEIVKKKKPRTAPTKKKVPALKPLMMDPNSNEKPEEPEEKEDESNVDNSDMLVLTGILDKKKFATYANKLRNEAAQNAVRTPMHYFPYIQLGKNTSFTARFSPEHGKTYFYIWRGKQGDDVENMKNVFKLSEAGFSNMLRSKEKYLAFTREIELYRQKCEAGLIKEAEQEKYLPKVPEPILLENTARGNIQMTGYMFNTGIGGGVSLRYLGAGGEGSVGPLGFTAAQFCVLMEEYLPLVQNVSAAVDSMYSTIRAKENIEDTAGPSDYWKIA